jgi:hypothetical protein
MADANTNIGLRQIGFADLGHAGAEVGGFFEEQGFHGLHFTV